MVVWMQITKDKYQLPLAIADTEDELAEIVGVSAGTIRQTIYKAKKLKRVAKYIKVKIED